MNNVRKRLFVPIICLGILVATLIVAWNQGWMGALLVRTAAFIILPHSPHETVEIKECRFERISETPAGMVLTIHPDRLKQDMLMAYPALRRLPPGTFQHIRSIHGFWRPEDDDLSGTLEIPIAIVCDPDTGWQPRLACSMPASEFNRIIATEFEGKLTRKREYFLGHYKMSYEPAFHTLEIHSENSTPDKPIESRRLMVSATGKVRFWFDDDLLKARATGKVKELRGSFDIGIVHDDEGIGISYDANISELDMSVDNLAPWGEKWLAEDLKSSMHKSLNKERKKRKLAEKRFPSWLPLDLDIEFHLTDG